jgi:hypothetical protein
MRKSQRAHTLCAQQSEKKASKNCKARSKKQVKSNIKAIEKQVKSRAHREAIDQASGRVAWQ